jgi:hypothetical protein
MAHHLKCPFCIATPSVGYFYKHLITQHLTEVFDEKTAWGKDNCRWLNATKARTTPHTLYLPKNETKFCCPSCCVAFNKVYYADKHIKCGQKTLETLEEYKGLLKLLPSEAPFAKELAEENPVESKGNDEECRMYQYREKVYQKVIYTLLCEIGDKEEWAFWFNRMNENNEVYDIYQGLKKDGMKMPEYDKYDISLECSKEMKILGLTYDTLQTVGRKKLPTPPS